MKLNVDGWARLSASLSHLVLAALYLLTWVGVTFGGAYTSLRYLAYLVLVEFVLLMLGLPLLVFLVGPLKVDLRSPLHLKLFLAGSGTIVVAMVAVGGVLSSSAGSNWPLIAVATLLAGKLRLFFRPPQTPLESRQILADGVVRVSALFFLLIPCVLIPLPSLGLPDSMEGFVDIRPSGLMAWGALYFGLFGLFGHRLDAMVEAGQRETPGS